VVSVYPKCECNFLTLTFTLTLNRNLTLNPFSWSTTIKIKSKIMIKNGENNHYSHFGYTLPGGEFPKSVNFFILFEMKHPS